MKLTLIITISMVGLMMPLFWITGTLASYVYFIRHRMDTIHRQWVLAVTP
jgi:hypothetical protein